MDNNTAQFTPTATATYRPDRDEWAVTVTWVCDTPGVLTRPSTGGWVFGPKHKRLAERLVAAVNAGVVFGTPTLRTDIAGNTFVQAPSKVLGRMANADLRRLGF